MINDTTTTTTTGQSQARAPFNPNEHLMQIKSRNGAADYLPVQWRLVWFRSLCPDGTIETEIVHLDLDKETEEETYQWNNDLRRSEKVIKRAPGFVVFRATVRDGRGGVATGTKSEKAASFSDYIEKGETGAIGRALAALGYGTQFTGDEFDERHRIVDAPVDRGSAGVAAENNHEQKAAPAASAKPVAVGGRAKTASNGHQKACAGAQEAQHKEEIDPNSPVTDQQWSTVRKLCQYLGKAEPQATDIMNYFAAKELIAQLSQEYRQSRKAAS